MHIASVPAAKTQLQYPNNRTNSSCQDTQQLQRSGYINDFHGLAVISPTAANETLQMYAHNIFQFPDCTALTP